MPLSSSLSSSPTHSPLTSLTPIPPSSSPSLLLSRPISPLLSSFVVTILPPQAVDLAEQGNLCGAQEVLGAAAGALHRSTLYQVTLVFQLKL